MTRVSLAKGDVVEIDPIDLAHFEDFLTATQNLGINQVIELGREFCKGSVWADVFDLSDRKCFRDRITSVWVWRSVAAYAKLRHAQLTDAGYSILVYQSFSCAQHDAWDGLFLPSNHPFWADNLPPNSWACRCGVAGARSTSSASRVGAKFISHTDLPPLSVEAPFRGRYPSLIEMVTAAIEGKPIR